MKGCIVQFPALLGQQFSARPHQRIHRLAAQVLLVEPLQLGKIVSSSMLINPFQTKGLNQFFHPKNFSVIPGIPAQECQKINISLREISGLPVAGCFLPVSGLVHSVA